MIRKSVKFLLSLVAALCVPVAVYCPWGFICAFEPGQEAFRVLFPMIFVGAIVIGSLSAFVAART
jgi:hypothetical protein